MKSANRIRSLGVAFFMQFPACWRSAAEKADSGKLKAAVPEFTPSSGMGLLSKASRVRKLSNGIAGWRVLVNFLWGGVVWQIQQMTSIRN
ncbi:MAG: hypothetical protein KDA96_01545 [Planctomycetaceae bacterium]|nr:hypothetical protein [Planctomycetaceae bacterium]